MPNSYSTSSILREHKIEIFLLLILGGFLSYLFFSFSEDTLIEETGQQEYILQLNNVEIQEHWLTEKRWKLLGKKASVKKDTDIVILTDVEIFVYDPKYPEKQEVDIIVSANEGEVDWKNEVVTLTTDVKMTRKLEMGLNTERAVYHYNKGILHIPENADIHYFEDTILGKQITYNINQKTFQISGAIWME
ncbi:MAG: LPS export ABC transporter periplasmic protein LptC [SAR324 cluster bacterium]|nr:LPS export ABC transporter periplasmic protein LptC [SAR324 cluster bacterium]